MALCGHALLARMDRVCFVTILLLIPVSVVSIQCFKATICDLGMGLAMLFTGSWPLAWLIGSLLGLAFRFLNKPPKSTEPKHTRAQRGLSMRCWLTH